MSDNTLKDSKIIKLSSNCIIVEYDHKAILYSYEKPYAAIDFSKNQFNSTNDNLTETTKKHIQKFKEYYDFA